MRDINALFAEYASYHQTAGNKWFHRFGIPLIVLSLLGMLARVPFYVAPILIVLVGIYSIALDWLLGAAMLAVSVLFYLAGAALPFWVDAALFVVGWILQFVGHSVYEKKQPAFLRNLVHLLVGPLWILNGVVHRRA
jgi:uncharacterized membrane protein YGL010W